MYKGKKKFSYSKKAAPKRKVESDEEEEQEEKVEKEQEEQEEEEDETKTPKEKETGSSKKTKTQTSEVNEKEKYIDLGNKKRIGFSDFKGYKRIAIREYYEDKSGELKPGKSGISITFEQWALIKKHMDVIDSWTKEK
ncbi:hypothetical protein CYY_004133 [Polysphondylium violaceum]|uniref:Transcriptional coactivator p15 (PC4) C-terminal domain-containing protein n=1 Tax=Polysphondylium violaceum TaxID=133409 RepID=A0A8J4UZJ4_9MYCE|nr:hypothetical protein CYY_004133 [Polysphondylium violaceum]